MRNKVSLKIIFITICFLLFFKTESNAALFNRPQLQLKSESCIKVLIEVYTKYFTSNLSWRLIDGSKDELLEQNGAFSRRSWNRKTIDCLEKEGAPYKIILNGAEGDGTLWGGEYRLSVNNVVVKEIPAQYQFNKIITTICTSDSHCNDGLDCTEDTCNQDSNTCKHVLKQSELCRSVGEHSVLVILVRGDDTAPSITQEDIISHVFGGDTGDKFSMKSQFANCSHNAFKTIPYSGTTITGKSIFHGVDDYHIQRNILGNQVGLIANEVFEKIDEIYGDLESQFGFVLICLPPGLMLGETDRWKAYAFIDSFKSIYNDKNCIYPSVLMHEIGHNLGLSHSNDVKTYGDETGMMGISYNSTTKPQKCFNPPKLWKTAWYHHSHLIIDVQKHLQPYSRKEFTLLSIVDAFYYKSEFGNSLIKLINLGKGYEYYLTFNRPVEFNQNTKEGKNEVLVTKREIGSAYSDSFLMGNVKFYHSFYITEMEGGQRVRVQANINIDQNIFYNNPPYATLILTKLGRISTKPCWRKNKLELIVDVETHNSPQYLYWVLTNLKNQKTVQSSHSLSKKNEVYTTSICVDVGDYAFMFAQMHNHSPYYDEESYENNTHAYFMLSMNNYIVDWDAVSEETYIENRFTVCKYDSHCFDYDGCSVDFCDKTLNLCDNIYEDNEECSSCTWFELNITTDNYPEETKWSLESMYLNKLILFGEPYSFGGDDDYVESGRRKAPTKSGRRKAPTKLGRRKAPTKSGRRKAPTRSGRRKAPTKSGRRKAPTRVSAHHQLQYSTFYSRRLVDEDDENDEDELISERICLNNYYQYRFKITDQFGDGICCSEGEGFYEIVMKDELVRRNGAYGDGEEVVFSPGSCSSSIQCDDNDPCTIDECRISISTCFYTKRPCNECGGNVKVIIRTDSYPENKIWKIYKDDEVVQEGGPFNVAKHNYEFNYCLKFGSYEFEMNSDNGFTSCNDFQNYKCGYEVMVNNVLTVESGNEYYDKETQAFGICQADSDCFDGDTCTVDKCDTTTHICIFKRDCALCSKALVEVGVETNVKKLDWKIYPRHSNKVLIENGIYHQDFTMEYHKTAVCLDGGEYRLLYEGESNFGCTLKEQCSYNVSVVNNIVVKEEYTYMNMENVHFKVPYHCNMDKDCNSIGITSSMRGICQDNYCKFDFACSSDEKFPMILSQAGEVWKISRFNSGEWDVVLSSTITARDGLNLYKNCLQKGYYKIVSSNEKRSLIVNNITVEEKESFRFGSYANAPIHYRSYFSLCFENNECDDNNKCTRDTCDQLTNMCIFTPLPCSECTANPCDMQHGTCIPSPCSECNNFHAKIGNIPQTRTYWKLASANDNKIYISSHQSKLSEQCIDPGDYHFSCFYTSCENYTLTIDDVIIKEGKIDTRSAYFTLCGNDGDCENGDSCVQQSCANFTCNYTPLPCQQCNKSFLTFKLSTRWRPERIKFEVIDMESGLTVWSDSPNSDQEKKDVLFNTCISNGLFKFIIENTYSLGINCQQLSCYSMSVNSELIFQQESKRLHFGKEEILFEVKSNSISIPPLTNNPSINLSAMPSNLPSSFSSTNPSYVPSTNPQSSSSSTIYSLSASSFTAITKAPTSRPTHTIPKGSAPTPWPTHTPPTPYPTQTPHAPKVPQTKVPQTLLTIYPTGRAPTPYPTNTPPTPYPTNTPPTSPTN